MNYEDKYKQALSRATFYNNELLTENQRKMLLDIFPELESEDERIRRVLLNDFKNNCSKYYCEGVNRDMIITWLEKQGKKLDADYVIEWLDKNAPKWLYDMTYPARFDVDTEDLVKQFKKDFGL